MSVAAIIALLSATLGAYIALLAWRYRLAPGLRDQGWFAAVAASATAFTALNVFTTSASAAPETIVWASKAQLACGAAHVAAWLRYASIFLGRTPRWERPAALALLAGGAAMLVPGVGFTGQVTRRAVGLLDVTYRDAEPSAVGALLLGVILALFVALAVRFAAAWRRDVPYAGAHLVALSLLFLMAGNDALLLGGAYDGLYLLDVGFLGPVAAVAYALSGRVVDESRGLADLRKRLEHEVAARTAELTASREALLRAEKLAALGQFSAGVSHEVANPTAVLSANLRYLADTLRPGAPAPADVRECLGESREAVERIAQVTRQLLDASRSAAAPTAPGARLAVTAAVQRALEATGALEGHDVEAAVDPGLAALAPLDGLQRVLEQLLDNAARAIRPGRRGRIRVRAEAVGGLVRIAVEDDGTGMSEETLRRAFDPFYSTRAFGTGRGMGLSVSRGLAQSMGGDLRLESLPERGTRAVLEVPLADGAPEEAAGGGGRAD